MRTGLNAAGRSRAPTAFVCIGLASAAAIANQAGTIPLSTLNGGPSSEIAPSGPGSRVAFFRWPSEVANTALAAPNPAHPLTNALEVQAGATGGIRNRERSLLSSNSDVRPGTGLRVVAANTGFALGASAADSYIGFMTLNQFNNVGGLAGITGVIDTIAELEAFFASQPAQRVYLSNVRVSGSAFFANADLDNADLAAGITLTNGSIFAAMPTYSFNQLAVVVFDDRSNAAADLPTEFAEITFNFRQHPVDAELDANNRTIRIRTNRPVADNEPGNPTDGIATPGASDFVILTGGSLMSFPAFLGALVPGAGGVASVTVEGERNDVIRIELANAVTAPAEVYAILGASIFFGNNDISSVVGDNTANSVTQAAVMNRPGCFGDANADRAVDMADLFIVLGAFGTAVGAGGQGDLNGDGVVGLADLNAVLSSFGEMC